MTFRLIVALLIFSTLISVSCADDIVSNTKSIPPAFGKTNELTILADQQMWDGPLGDTLDYYYTGAYPITPTPEPILDLRHFNHYEISKSTVFKHYRSYLILANLGNQDSKFTQMVIQDIGQEKYRKALKDPEFNSIVGKNKWARGQILIYLFAPTESELVDVVKSKLPDIMRRVYSHDAEQVRANTFAGGENVIAQNALREMLQVRAEIPKDFEIAKKSTKDNLIWLRKDDNKSIQNIIVRRIPYTSDEQFDNENIIALVDEYGSKHIDNNKLLVNDRDLPTYEVVRNKDGKYIKEIRGIWEAKVSFMGGPYIAQLIKYPDSDELIFALSFIYAPGEKKRNLMQRAEVIMARLEATDIK